jgi:deoxyribose-phosphate aldolase
MNIESHIELTVLKPDTLVSDIESACNEAVENNISKICVPPLFVRKAKELTIDTNIGICAVIGFPFGYSPVEAKWRRSCWRSSLMR